MVTVFTQFVLPPLLLLGLLQGVVLVLIYMERKLSARFQLRIGPMRVGPRGTFQLFADGIKLVSKEDITPSGADRISFFAAPVLAVVGAFAAYAVIPFGKGLVAADLNIGLLYILAITSVIVISILCAGFGSNSKWTLLGGLRSAAQVISYELPLILSLLPIVMIVGSLSLVDIVEAQHPFWFILFQPVAFILYLIAATAEVNRTPFDLPEAESELVAGYFTEYSGMKFAMFFLAEYINMFTVACIGTILFLGGWQGPFLSPVIWFFAKCFLIIFLLMWFRWTLPRVRVDQLMDFGWKVLLPLTLLNLGVTGLVLSLL